MSAPVVTTLYLQCAGGSLTKIEGVDTLPVAPPGCTPMTEAAYNTAIANAASARATAIAAQKSTEAANALADYNALIAKGFTTATAARLSGYTP